MRSRARHLLLIERFGDACFFRLLGVQQVVVFGFLLGADQVAKSGGGVGQFHEPLAVNPALAGQGLAAYFSCG
jgi:hypothetical protein